LLVVWLVVWLRQTKPNQAKPSFALSPAIKAKL